MEIKIFKKFFVQNRKKLFALEFIKNYKLQNETKSIQIDKKLTEKIQQRQYYFRKKKNGDIELQSQGNNFLRIS